MSKKNTAQYDKYFVIYYKRLEKENKKVSKIFRIYVIEIFKTSKFYHQEVLI
jgi:hypothetical protein